MDLAVLWPPDFYTTRPLHLHQSLQNGSFFGYWPGEACIRAWDLGSRRWGLATAAVSRDWNEFDDTDDGTLIIDTDAQYTAHNGYPMRLPHHLRH